MPDAKTLEAARQQKYGPPDECHNNIALAWQAYLQQTRRRHLITRYDVANMMALVKIIRSGYSPSHQDNYDDAITYLTFARRFACGEEERSD